MFRDRNEKRPGESGVTDSLEETILRFVGRSDYRPLKPRAIASGSACPRARPMR